MNHSNKLTKLKEFIKKLGKVCIAFSGGVDSTLLLKVAHDVLGDDVLAITINSPYIADWEIEEAKEFTNRYQIPHTIIDVEIMDVLLDNPKERCYICKRHIFNMIIELAKEKGFYYVLDGSNFDDTKDFRPGMKALKELHVVSPLLENQIDKVEVRKMAKELGLPIWDKPAYACLMTRLPHNTRVDKESLRRIELSEKYLMDLGFKAVRVRSHGALARIEVPKDNILRLMENELADAITKKLKEFGFQFVTIDLLGYQIGSFNSMIDPQ
ncbi:MAG: ATP-dependent sacrificial sulfur transferase LarE [Balneolaceae bacterium]